MTKTFCAVVLALGACGGSKGPAATAAGGDETGAHNEGEHDEHSGMPAEMAAFHDVLAPLWHVEPAQARMDKYCADANVEAVSVPADALVAAPAPAGVDAEAWATTVGRMGNEFADTFGACSLDLATFDATFGAAHDLFHDLMEMLAQASGAS